MEESDTVVQEKGPLPPKGQTARVPIAFRVQAQTDQ
jgi:hypothetical protein